MNNWLKDFILYGWELYTILMETIIFSLASIPFILGVFDILKGIFPSDDIKDWKFFRFLLLLRGCLCVSCSFMIMYMVLFIQH